MDMEQRIITDLPEDIITLILITLPIKTIVQLKCVSKFFKEFVSAPEFVKTHLKFSTECDSSRYTVIANNCGFEDSVMQLHLTSQPHDHFTGRGDPVRNYGLDMIYFGVYHKLNHHARAPGIVMGSCHGLLCSISYRKHCILWNPCVFKGNDVVFNKLPRPFDFTQGCLDIMYALGYDNIDDDYKVVAFCVFRKQRHEQEQQADQYYSVPMVFSLKRNSWNKIGTGYFEGVVDSHAKFADGKIYWLTETKYNDDKDSEEMDVYRPVVYFKKRDIVSFDVHNEVLEIVEHPHYEGTGPFGLSLGEVNGSIAVFCHERERRGSNADIWVMSRRRDEKHSWTWTKVGTTPSRYGKPRVRSCSTLPEGAILLFTGRYLQFYHPQTNKMWEDATRGMSTATCSNYYFFPVLYVQNLVSPFQTS